MVHTGVHAVVVLAEGNAGRGRTVHHVEYLAVEGDHGVLRLYLEEHVLLRDGLLDLRAHRARRELHNIYARLLNGNGEIVVPEDAELRVADRHMLYAKRNVHPDLARLLHHVGDAQRADVERETRLRGLYLDDGAAVAVLVELLRALLVGHLVRLVEVEVRHGYLRAERGKAGRSGKKEYRSQNFS